MKQLNKYVYDGPVMLFDTCVCNRWKGETLAYTEAKAKSNLAYRYKKEHGQSADLKIRLSGKVTMVG